MALHLLLVATVIIDNGHIGYPLVQDELACCVLAWDCLRPRLFQTLIGRKLVVVAGQIHARWQSTQVRFCCYDGPGVNACGASQQVGLWWSRKIGKFNFHGIGRQSLIVVDQVHENAFHVHVYFSFLVRASGDCFLFYITQTSLIVRNLSSCINRLLFITVQ
jgi:hypothetical protein